MTEVEKITAPLKELKDMPHLGGLPIVGDPLKGRERLTYQEFMEKWRKIGVIVSREE